MRAFSVAAVLLAGTAAQAGPFDGVYFPRGSKAEAFFCTDTSWWRILGDRFVMEEGGCDLAAPVPVRDMQAVLYDAQCNMEIEESRLRLFISAQRDGIVVVTSDGLVFDLVNCDR